MIEIIIFFVMISCGYFFGRQTERRHYKSIIRREKEYHSFPVRTQKSYEGNYEACFVVMGNMVVSIDYFKFVSAAIKNLFGGTLTSYESLLDRARREATLRMVEMAASNGAKEIVNFRIETAPLFKGNSQSPGCVEVFAYGTALK